MNRIVKIVFLGLLIIIPIVLVLFLRYFGENRFDIPVYYDTGVKEDFSAACEFPDGPYTISDTLLNQKGVALIMFFEESGEFDYFEMVNQINRLQEIFAEQLSTIHVYSHENIANADVIVKQLPEQTLENMMHCIFITPNFNQYILIDKENQIRGYYNTDLDEVDRLIVETKILLENGGS